jgi:hypothetical protein
MGDTHWDGLGPNRAGEGKEQLTFLNCSSKCKATVVGH